MTKLWLLASFFIAVPSLAFGCASPLGIDFSEINARVVLVEARVESAYLDTEKHEYAFKILVNSTIKGPDLPSWTVRTKGRNDHVAKWFINKTVYIGFDISNLRDATAVFPSWACQPLGIVLATPENLKKIRSNVVEPSAF